MLRLVVLEQPIHEKLARRDGILGNWHTNVLTAGSNQTVPSRLAIPTEKRHWRIIHPQIKNKKET